MNDYALLFEPVRIGPVMAPNRFYQVPHCNGMGYRHPEALAAMRGAKAEGGWGVVCTEEVEIHATSDLAPYLEGRLWADEDMPALRRMVDAVHAHGSLAGIELVHSGINAPNLYTRAVPMGARTMSVTGGTGYEPVQARTMTKADIRDVRRWHRAAAIRSRDMGFDLVYCYAGHLLSLPMQFMSRRHNDRTDEYGGSLENRVRLFRELIDDAKDAVGDRCGIVARLAVDELLGPDGIECTGEGRDIVAMLAEHPDLWDINISGWSNDSATSRFEKEGYQERYSAFVKTLTTKPVVGVGRYTSPDAMVSAIRRGILDLIGAARPSIADPFLPNKIRTGRVDDIRECIGCNICVAADSRLVPIRCTQNPTMGEEWRRGWHPERVSKAPTPHPVLVIGAGPAGLECARVLGEQGHQVTLTEARDEVGGRVVREAALPGLAEWRRVVDWRVTQLKRLRTVEVLPGNTVTASEVLGFEAKHVIVATGAAWRRDGIGRGRWRAMPGHDLSGVHTPDDVMDGAPCSGRVIVYDNDHYYMGGVLAERLARMGCTVTLVTPAALVSIWTQNTLEQERIQRRLLGLDVTLLAQTELTAITAESVVLRDHATGRDLAMPRDQVVLVTDRIPNDALVHALAPALGDGRLTTLRAIGDADGPGLIAQAVYAGHLAARSFTGDAGGEQRAGEAQFRVERARTGP